MDEIYIAPSYDELKNMEYDQNFLKWRVLIGERMNLYLWKSRVYSLIYLFATILGIGISFLVITLNIISLSIYSGTMLIVLNYVTFSLAVANGLLLTFMFIVKPRSNAYKLEMCRRKYRLLFDELLVDILRKNDSDHRDVFYRQREELILSRQSKFRLMDDLLPKDTPIAVKHCD